MSLYSIMVTHTHPQKRTSFSLSIRKRISLAPPIIHCKFAWLINYFNNHCFEFKIKNGNGLRDDIVSLFD